MVIGNINIGINVEVDSTSNINNVKIGDNVKIAKYCSVFGSRENIAEIGDNSYVGMFSILNGFANKLKIGKCVSIAQNVNIMTNSGPNASELMKQFYPIEDGPVTIEDHVWIGASVIIMPNVRVGRCSIIAANSYVNSNIEPYSLYAGTPAKFIKRLETIKDYESKNI